MLGRPFIIAGKVRIYLGLAGLNRPLPIIFLSYSELGNYTVNLVDLWPLFRMTFVVKMPFEALLGSGPLLKLSDSQDSVSICISIKIHIQERKAEIMDKIKQDHWWYVTCLELVALFLCFFVQHTKTSFKCRVNSYDCIFFNESFNWGFDDWWTFIKLGSLNLEKLLLWQKCLVIKCSLTLVN